MISYLLLVETWIFDLIFEFFWQTHKLSCLLIDHDSIFPFGLILKLKLWWIGGFFDDGPKLSLFYCYHIRRSLLIFSSVPTIFRLIFLPLLKSDRLWPLSFNNLSQLKNDVILCSGSLNFLDFFFVNLETLIDFINLILLGWEIEDFSPSSRDALEFALVIQLDSHVSLATDRLRNLGLVKKGVQFCST